MRTHLEIEETSLGGVSLAAPGGSGWEAWFCVRTHARREQVAAAQLRQDPAIEVFLPCIRFERPTRLSRAWTTEALFQNYLFARFDLAACGRRIRHARAVRDVVHFGARYPTINETVIAELRRAMGREEVCVVANSFDPGDLVRIAGGPFHDLEAVVVRAMPRRQRVAVLLDFLGRQTSVEIKSTQLTAALARPRLADLACSAAAFS